MIAKCKKGFRLDKKKNKCVKNNPSRKKYKSSSKSYNPFKMWGSYVGAYLIPTILSFILIKIDIGEGFVLGFEEIIAKTFFWWTRFVPSAIIFLPIVGFLIGWGIHSIVRKVRK